MSVTKAKNCRHMHETNPDLGSKCGFRRTLLPEEHVLPAPSRPCRVRGASGVGRSRRAELRPPPGTSCPTGATDAAGKLDHRWNIIVINASATRRRTCADDAPLQMHHGKRCFVRVNGRKYTSNQEH